MRISDWSSDVCSSDLCSTKAAFCWVTSLSCNTASLIRAMPEVCSLVAALISLIRSVTCWTCLTMPVMAAHFAGHNGKAAALFAGAGRFHGCIQRQDIRLKRSEEHTSELQSLMRISYAVFCLKKK